MNMRTPFKLASGPATPPVSHAGPFRDEFRRWPLTLSPPLGENRKVSEKSKAACTPMAKQMPPVRNTLRQYNIPNVAADSAIYQDRYHFLSGLPQTMLRTTLPLPKIPCQCAGYAARIPGIQTLRRIRPEGSQLPTYPRMSKSPVE
jgi:hypothetical protein